MKNTFVSISKATLCNKVSFRKLRIASLKFISLAICLIVAPASLAEALPNCAYDNNGSIHEIYTEFLDAPMVSLRQFKTYSEYLTETEAVTAASELYNPKSVEQDREFIGAVLKNKQTGLFTFNVYPGKRGQDQVNANIQYSSRFELVAIWHTHGAKHYSRKYFSREDVSLSKQLNKPMYLADPYGNLRVVLPNSRTLTSIAANRLGLGFQGGFSKGEIVKSETTGKPIKVASSVSQLNDNFSKTTVAYSVSSEQCVRELAEYREATPSLAQL